MCTLSIIIPLFKGSRYINTITHMIDRNRDVLKTTNTQVNIEVIFVNDYPDEYVENNDSVYVLVNHRNNEGIHKSRIDGLEVSKGEYILFLDQDDSISDDYVASQMSVLLNNNADWVICNGIFRTSRIIYPKSEDIQNVLSSNYYFDSLTNIISPGQVVIKREAIPILWKTNILKQNYCDDAFLWMLLYNKGIRPAYNDNIAFFHNENGDNTSFDWEKNVNALIELKDKICQLDVLAENNKNAFIKTVDREIGKQRTIYELSIKYPEIENRSSEISSLLKKYNGLIIYGFGFWGRKLYELVKDYFETIYVVDKNLNCDIEGIKVLDTEQFEKIKIDTPSKFLVCITASSETDIIREYLLNLGFSNIYEIDCLFDEIINSHFDDRKIIIQK